jgi:hypothetical protein
MIECECCYTYLDGNGECPCMWVDDCPDEPECEMRKVRKANRRNQS